MKLIVGLGNPGPDYESSRHNAGYWIIDSVSERIGLELTKKKFKAVYASGKYEGIPLVMLKPLTYMNLSGLSVSAAMSFFNIDFEDLLVIHDDVDLPPGRIRMKKGGGSAGHKGVESIVDQLGADDFYRLRFGVGRPENLNMDTSDFVLERVSSEEKEAFGQWSKEAADAALYFLKEGLLAAQNRFHAK